MDIPKHLHKLVEVHTTNEGSGSGAESFPRSMKISVHGSLLNLYSREGHHNKNSREGGIGVPRASNAMSKGAPI
jgi:hypothetical protein